MRIIVNYGKNKTLVSDDERGMGGVAGSALNLSLALGRRNHDVHLFARCPDPGPLKGIVVHDRSELAEFARAEPADVLILIPQLLCVLMPIPASARVVWTGNAYSRGDAAIHRPWDWAPELGRKGRRVQLYRMDLLHPLVDRVVVGSKWHAGRLSENAAVPAAKVRVIYLGVRFDHFEPDASAPHRTRLIYASQPRRGLDELLRLFPRIRESVPDAELHVLGTGPGEAPPGVRFHGWVDKHRVAAELQASAVMAYPTSFLETFCLAVAEAQTAGLPVVTTDLGALAERITPGDDGVLVSGTPGDPLYDRSFTDAVIHLLENERLRRSMGDAARAKARRLYDWDEIAHCWERELLEIVPGRRPAAPSADVDLLAPSSLRHTSGGKSVQIDPDLAERWIREEWASYGYDPLRVPGLPTR